MNDNFNTIEHMHVRKNVMQLQKYLKVVGYMTSRFFGVPRNSLNV